MGGAVAPKRRRPAFGSLPGVGTLFVRSTSDGLWATRGSLNPWSSTTALGHSEALRAANTFMGRAVSAHSLRAHHPGSGSVLGAFRATASAVKPGESKSQPLASFPGRDGAKTAASTAGGSDSLDPSNVSPRRSARRKRGPLSADTKARISSAMLGQRKSDAMRAKVSRAMKGRIPWNKGKKLSAETRARMSEAATGRPAWNKGRPLSRHHRLAISESSSRLGRRMSAETRSRMLWAKRRPGDAIVGGHARPNIENGDFPLMDAADINTYVTLRRELRGWSDQFTARNQRRPSLADVRRTAPPRTVRMFEEYVVMREKIRGLASDVYGGNDPSEVSVVGVKKIASESQNNNAGTVVAFTPNGNPRLVPKHNPNSRIHRESPAFSSGAPATAYSGSGLVADGHTAWDEYDTPQREDSGSTGHLVDSSFIGGTVEFSDRRARKDGLSPNDYRAIGRYRLLESRDINSYMQLRRELSDWSAKFKERYGRTPALSDVGDTADAQVYHKFCDYIEARARMSGLVQEVYGSHLEHPDDIEKLATAGKALVDQLKPPSVQSQIERVRNRSPPTPLPADDPEDHNK